MTFEKICEIHDAIDVLAEDMASDHYTMREEYQKRLAQLVDELPEDAQAQYRHLFRADI